MTGGRNYKFIGNLLMGVTYRSGGIYPVLGYFVTAVDGDYTVNNYEVRDNVATGSAGAGLYLMGVGCNQISSNGVYNNTAGNCMAAAIAYR